MKSVTSRIFCKSKQGFRPTLRHGLKSLPFLNPLSDEQHKPASPTLMGEGLRAALGGCEAGRLGEGWRGGRSGNALFGFCWVNEKGGAGYSTRGGAGSTARGDGAKRGFEESGEVGEGSYTSKVGPIEGIKEAPRISPTRQTMASF